MRFLTLVVSAMASMLTAAGAFAHLREAHPDMADEYEREHILFMAQKFVKKA